MKCWNQDGPGRWLHLCAVPRAWISEWRCDGSSQRSLTWRWHWFNIRVTCSVSQRRPPFKLDT